jgi:hypothetical protein
MKFVITARKLNVVRCSRIHLQKADLKLLVSTHKTSYKISIIEADLEKTGILGSWILRNISQNQQEHFDQLSAYY